MTGGFHATRCATRTHAECGKSLDIKGVKRYTQTQCGTIQILDPQINPVKRKIQGRRKSLEATNDNLAADLLRGADAIAAFLGFPRRTVYHAVAKGHLPHFRIGETVCARKSTLARWIEQQEAVGAAA